MNLLSLVTDVTVFNQAVTGAAHAETLVDAGCRAALPNVLEGPAMTAPALFTGFAAAGLAALYLL